MRFKANTGSQAPGGDRYCVHCTYHFDFHNVALVCPTAHQVEARAKALAAEAATAQGVDFTEHHAEVARQLTIAAQDAPALLAKAASIMAERAKEYDQPGGERSMGRTVAALNAVLGRPALTEAEGWLFMQLLKDVRLFTRPGYHADSAEDGIAYTALMAEAKQGEVRHG